MRSRVTWHDRPILGPLIYGVSAVIVAAGAYATGYLLTERPVNGIYAVLFMDSLLVLFLRVCHRSAMEGDR